MAAPAQPQLVFVDGSFAELAQEMADYLNISDDIKPLLEKDQKDDALKKIIAASTALNSMPEKEFTAAYNLLVYLVLQSEKPNDLLPSVCENLLKPITSSPANGPGLALSALTNIFNMLKPDNTLRQTVFTTILRFLKQHNMFDVVKRYLPHLEMWFEQWKTSEEDQRKLYEQIAETASEGGDQEAASEYTIKALNTFDETSAKTDAAQQLSLRAVRASISSPTQFDFQGLRAIPAIQALSESHPVYSELLDIFAEKDLEDYTDFCEEHAGFIEKEKLDDEKLTRKMRLLTFASLAASISSREIPYQAIAKALNISQEQVEIWTIDVIRAGLVEGRLSQQKQLFLVHKTTYRVFGEKQWRELSDRLDLWKGVFTTVIGTLRREQANADAQRKREQEDIERKLAGIGMGGVPTGNRDNRRGERPPRKERTDDDD